MDSNPVRRLLRSQRDVLLGGVCLALALLASGALGQSLDDATLVVEPYLTGLSQPTGVRFSGPGEGFAIEKESGRVIRFAGSQRSIALDLNVQSDSERGLLGIALDPQFSTNGYVYLYYSATSAGQDGGTWTENRLVRYQWNGSALVGTGQSRTFGTSADGLDNGPNHDGGPLVFGPDQKLYGATGDLNRRRTEQNTATSPANQSANTGGIYRLNNDLTAPNDNPFSGSFAQWYAYGVRNSFGLAVDPRTGNLWDTENGPNLYDEVNLVGRGFNSGWVQIMGPDARDDQGVGDLVVLPGSAYSDPEFSFRAPIGITSIQFLANSNWGPAYENGVLIGDNNTGRLYLLQLNAARDGFVATDNSLLDLVADSAAETSLLAFGSGFSTVTDIQVGPDGAVYVMSLYDGILYRIAPVPEPQTWVLMLGGALLLWGARRRLRAQPA